MSTDFKALWNREESRVPDIREIFIKANKLNRRTRLRIMYENITLTGTIGLNVWVWWTYHPELITTKIGLVMMIFAMIAYLALSNRQIPLLLDGNAETDSRKYLAQMISIKKKQEFLGTTIMRLYYILISLGISLYMLEYVRRGSLAFQLSVYGITLGCMAIAWFYITPLGINKRRKAINDVIARLEELNGQLSE